MKLNINFYAENADENTKNTLMLAVEHETCMMTVEMLNDDIARLQTRISNLNGNKTKSEDKKAVEMADLRNKLAETEAEKVRVEAEAESTLDAYNEVLGAMTIKNENHFGNKADVVQTVLRVLGTWNNSKLVKYAIIPAFESPALYNALETIHVLSKADEDGMTILTDEVKKAYKDASNELESIIKNTFSLPFATRFTEKTRVKLTASDKKLLNDCYVKGFKNKFSVDEDTELVDFSKRQINTLVKVKKNKQTGKKEYDYSGLANTICEIVIKHYFA